MKKRKPKITFLPKSPTGIRGLDEITGGGLPRGRPTLVCGPAGSGKTLLAMEFLVHGAREYGENGVFLAFEETRADLADNVASLGFEVNALIAAGKLSIDYVYIEPVEIRQSGEFDLEALFIRLDYAIKAIGAKRVVLDTVEALLSGLPDPALLRGELRRLFRWLKERGLTAIITAESGENAKALTRSGIEEYVSDCVIFLDHRVANQTSTRRLRIAKYRGSAHGTNEYPFLIDEEGISVFPVTSMALEHRVSTERISSGIPRLDSVLGGKGYFRGSSILISGTAGSGKTSVAAHFVEAACQRGERCLHFLFEESPGQMMRNMHSIGIDLQSWVKKGLLQFHAARPSQTGLEMHLAITVKAIRDFAPRVVVVDPISAFISMGNASEVRSMVVRLLDFLKTEGITALFTSLLAEPTALNTDASVYSLIDTWILLRDIEQGGERNRALDVMKSRGMAHSNQVREFLLTSHGVELIDVYVGAAGVLAGSARLKQEFFERNQAIAAVQENTLKESNLAQTRRALQSQIDVLQAEIRAAELESSVLESQRLKVWSSAAEDRISMGKIRMADVSGSADRHRAKKELSDETSSGKAASKGNAQPGRRRVGAATVRRGPNAKVRNGAR